MDIGVHLAQFRVLASLVLTYTPQLYIGLPILRDGGLLYRGTLKSQLENPHHKE